MSPSEIDKMKMFLRTQTSNEGAEEETITIADTEGNTVFITEADWIEMGRMRDWKDPGPTDDNAEEIPLDDFDDEDEDEVIM